MKFVNDRNTLLEIFPKNAKVAELGIFRGDFSKILLEKLTPHELYLVDTFPTEMCSGDKDGNNMVYENLDQFYSKIVELYKDTQHVKIIKNTSHSFLESLPDGYLDAVYIDADHSYESVKKDLELSFKKVKPNGIIAGHDYLYMRDNDQITRAVNEFCKENNREIAILTKDGCPTFVIYNTPTGTLQNFPIVNCISLEESVERRNNICKQFLTYGISSINFLISKRYKESNDKIIGKFAHALNQGTAGCCVSHLKSIKQWLENTVEEYGFFCEDDLSIETIEFWKETWQQFIETLPNDWECVQLLTLKKDYTTLDLRERIWDDWGATAYILKRNYAQKIVNSYCLSDESYKLELPEPHSNTQPLIENLLFTIGKTYVKPLFVENIKFKSTFAVCAEHNAELHQDTHYNSYNNTINMWKKIEKKSNKVIDYFTFYEPMGKEMLELRINLLKDYVDEFIICESNKTQSGEKIPYTLSKIISNPLYNNINIKVIELDIPENEQLTLLEEDKINCYESNSLNENSVRARARERMQKDALLKVIDNYDNDTVFIHSDIDEIINPTNIEWVSNIVRQNPDILIKIPLVHLEGRADLRVHYKHNNLPKEWTGMFMATKQHFKKATPTQLRSNANNPFPVNFVTHNNEIIRDMGWHFSWMGGASIRKIKCKNFTHYDDTFTFLTTSKYKNNDTDFFQEQLILDENQIPPSGDKTLLLKKYPIESLPSKIFELNDNIQTFLFPKETNKIVEVSQYATNVNNPECNFNMGLFYYRQGHTAPALSYFLRCAERAENNVLAYEALIFGYLCYKEQKIRDETAKSLIMHAVCLLPERPEARWILSVFFEQKSEWMYAYYHACQGLKYINNNFESLKYYRDYPGKYALLFQKAIVGYWWGKNEEYKTILLDLYNNYELNDTYKDLVKSNLKRVGIEIT